MSGGRSCAISLCPAGGRFPNPSRREHRKGRRTAVDVQALEDAAATRHLIQAWDHLRSARGFYDPASARGRQVSNLTNALDKLMVSCQVPNVSSARFERRDG